MIQASRQNIWLPEIPLVCLMYRIWRKLRLMAKQRQDVERITLTDLSLVAEGTMRYSVFLNETGGVLDDLIISRLDGRLRLVVNAGRAEHDIAFLNANLDSDILMSVKDDCALLALRGYRQKPYWPRWGPISGLYFMQLCHAQIAGIDQAVMRSGYTGEDGFEILLVAKDAIELAETLAAMMR